MISVIIPTLNAETSLAAALTALVPAAVDGVVRQVIIVDAGSTDRTLKIADHAGAEAILAPLRGRGRQLADGAAQARFSWLLFLHSDTVLADGWHREAACFIDRVDTGRLPLVAGAFRFMLDDLGLKPRLLEMAVSARCSLLRLPYGDQGLLIAKRLYDEVGGYRPLSIMEDVDLVRRLGRARITILSSAAVTSSLKYRRDGYMIRSVRNATCLALYYLRAPTRLIEKVYG
jgi:rSAM/selenodomain-associated transferase 2